MNENMFENFNSSSSSNSDNKVLTKTMPGAASENASFDLSNKEEIIKNEPFVTPVIDFFADMPVVDETFIKPIAMPISDDIVNNNMVIDIPVNDVATPVFDMPDENAPFIFNNDISVNTVVNDISTENSASNNAFNDFSSQTFSDFTNIQDQPISVVNNEALNDFNTTPIDVNSQSLNGFTNVPVLEKVEVDNKFNEEIQTMSGNELLNNFSSIVSNEQVKTDDFKVEQQIENPVSSQIVFNDNVKVSSEIDTPVINTMSSNEMLSTFNSVIKTELNAENSQVEPYKEVSDNTFSSIFANVPNDDKTFFTVEEKKSVSEGRPELIEPVRKMKKEKKRIIPKGYGPGIAIFILMYAFVLNLDKITEYFQNMNM